MKFMQSLVVASAGFSAVAESSWSLSQAALNLLPGTGTKPAKRPNILFIITDDQDLTLGSTEYTPRTARHIKDKGTFFRNHFVTTALCCPSRVSLWTGRQAHNTNVTDVKPPYGGYPKFVERGFNDDFLPIWLQEAGYNTYYTGKLFNAHTVNNYNKPHVAGFNSSDFLLDPFTYDYYNSTYQRNYDAPVSYEGRHTTEVITEKASGLLDDALEGDRPFFLGVSPTAPHSNVNGSAVSKDRGKMAMTEPIPQEKHKHLFSDVKVPRSESFNPEEPSGVSWVRHLPLQNQTVVDYNDHFYRQRLRSLQGVDELVESLVARLEESGQLDNTYIMFTSDNGFHVGQHRLPPGKSTGFDEDIRVPFYIRGPGVAEGEVQDAVTTHIDLAPTLFKLAGIQPRDDFDGTPIPIGLDDTTHEHVTVEYWGNAVLEGEYRGLGNQMFVPENTYKSLRIIGDGYDLYYSVFCNNDHELYDLTTDPYEMNNLYTHGSEPHILGYSLPHVISRLDALLFVLKSCQGPTCIKPWNFFHPDDSVQTLHDALDSQYNAFYQAQPRVAFDRCEHGYILDAEGPQAQWFDRDGLSWEAWT